MTFLFTDVEGSTRRWEAYADGMRAALTIETAFGVLRQVLGAARRTTESAATRCDGVQLPKRKHADRGYLTDAQVAALAAAVEYRPEVVRLLA